MTLYNKLTKKNKFLTEREERKDEPLHWDSTGEPIFGNSVNSQISEFKYTKIAVHFHQSRYFF